MKPFKTVPLKLPAALAPSELGLRAFFSTYRTDHPDYRGGTYLTLLDFNDELIHEEEADSIEEAREILADLTMEEVGQ